MTKIHNTSASENLITLVKATNPLFEEKGDRENINNFHKLNGNTLIPHRSTGHSLKKGIWYGFCGIKTSVTVL